MFGLYTFGQTLGQQYGGAFLFKSYVAAAVVGSLAQIALRQYQINSRFKELPGSPQRPLLIGTRAPPSNQPLCAPPADVGRTAGHTPRGVFALVFADAVSRFTLI
jgi:hypothetical protein